MRCTEDDRLHWTAYVKAFGYSYDESNLRHAQDAFAGRYSSAADFAEVVSGEEFDLNEIPNHLLACIDWQHVWSSYFRFDFVEQDGFFFNRNH
jgi:hypothetical protein